MPTQKQPHIASVVLALGAWSLAPLAIESDARLACTGTTLSKGQVRGRGGGVDRGMHPEAIYHRLFPNAYGVALNDWPAPFSPVRWMASGQTSHRVRFSSRLSPSWFVVGP
ncbi:hypothetical protein BC834DRAFT_911962 [Gloeopeniophorella convolvens]|nr:hypothetical protein BC834DRAFT_911962 [Gloeopeniophorella convolvens]